jgi:hypothetical protein
VLRTVTVTATTSNGTTASVSVGVNQSPGASSSRLLEVLGAR